MNSKVFAAGLAASVIPALASCNPTPGPQPLGAPAPILYLTGAEAYSTGGKDWIRHNYDVLNKDQYDPALFAAAPSLPPCGLNTNSSRTWDRSGSRPRRAWFRRAGSISR